MALKIAINGFGRIGRNAFKIAENTEGVEVVAVNDLADTKTLAHLLKHDSNYGIYHQEVGFDEQNIIVDARRLGFMPRKTLQFYPGKILISTLWLRAQAFLQREKTHKNTLMLGPKE